MKNERKGSERKEVKGMKEGKKEEHGIDKREGGREGGKVNERQRRCSAAGFDHSHHIKALGSHRTCRQPQHVKER